MSILSNEEEEVGSKEYGSKGVHPKLAELEFWMEEQGRLGKALEKLAELLEKAVGERETGGQGDEETGRQGDEETKGKDG